MAKTTSTKCDGDELVEAWAHSLVDHLRPNSKLITFYVDRHDLVHRWSNFKLALLGPWWVPWWCPLYAALTHYTRRQKNLYLVENHYNYRPYKYRRNDEDSKYY